MTKALFAHLKKLDPEEVGKWWSDHAPSETPPGNREWKYRLEKDGKSLPFKFLMVRLGDFLNHEITSSDLTSNRKDREWFADRFGFRIIDNLAFTQVESQTLSDYMRGLTGFEMVEQLVEYANWLVREVGIDPYLLRFALSKGNEFLAELGWRTVLNYTENGSGEYFLGFLVSAELANHPDFAKHYLYEYKGGDGYRFIKTNEKTWADIDQRILDDHESQIIRYYEQIRTTRLSDIRRGSQTTNAAAKFMVYRDVNPVDWLKQYSRNAGYWVFRFRPDGKFDIRKALRDGHLLNYTIRAGKREIGPGDRFLVVLTGIQEVVGFGVVVSPVQQLSEDDRAIPYWSDTTEASKTEDRVRLRMEMVFPERPIPASDLPVKVREDLIRQNQVNNFKIRRDSYRYIEDIAIQNIMDFIDFGGVDYYASVAGTPYRANDRGAKWFYDTRWKLEKLVSRLSKRMDQEFNVVYKERPNGQAGRGRIHFKEYVLIGFSPASESVGENMFVKLCIANLGPNPRFYVDVDVNFKDALNPYNPKRDQLLEDSTRSWDIKSEEFPDNWDELVEMIVPAVEHALEVYRNARIVDDLDGDSGSNGVDSDPPAELENEPLNQILYGPPGTGKTYHLLHQYFPKFTVENARISKKKFEEDQVTQLPWWKVIALVLATEDKKKVGEIKAHPYTQYKINASQTNSLDQTLWGELGGHTIQESKTVKTTDRTGLLVFDKTETDSLWYLVPEAKEAIPDIFELAERLQRFESDRKTRQDYRFITFHQSFVYEDFVEGIKPDLSGNKESAEGHREVSYHIRDGVFYQCCEQAARLAGFASLKDCIENHSLYERKARFVNARPYGLFIDEINRGNVSAILGELITLLEPDKRLGNNEVLVQLPYSGRRFGVPPNLYIIGTMNTADRSVEALDSALRRRFSFVEMPPNPDLRELKEKIEGWEWTAGDILRTLNKRLLYFLDRDHLIGHSFYIRKTTPQAIYEVFQDHIIPQLKEYFFGHHARIAAILGWSQNEGEAFVTRRELKAEFGEIPDELDAFEARTVWDFHSFFEEDDTFRSEAFDAAMNRFMNARTA